MGLSHTRFNQKKKKQFVHAAASAAASAAFSMLLLLLRLLLVMTAELTMVALTRAGRGVSTSIASRAMAAGRGGSPLLCLSPRSA